MTIKIILYCLLLFISNRIFAEAYQINPVLNSNPAILHNVNTLTAMLGGSAIDIREQYTGSVGAANGTALSDTLTGLPYFRFAYRLTPKWVAAIDVTSPVLANIRYPMSSIVAPEATDTILYDYNYSPKLSYQINNNIAIGVGFDLNHVTNDQINFAVSPLGKMINKGTGWSYGWDAGFDLNLNQFNALSVSYSSIINFEQLTGFSQVGSLYQSNFSENLVLPASFSLTLAHQVTDRWTLSETAQFTQWSSFKTLTFTNSALGNQLYILNYQDTWSGILTARYQWFESFGVNLTAEYDTSPQSIIDRPIAYPASSVTVLGGGVDYALSKQWGVQIQYAYLFANPAIQQTGRYPQAGHVKVGINMLDVGLVLKM